MWGTVLKKKKERKNFHLKWNDQSAYLGTRLQLLRAEKAGRKKSKYSAE